jgi:hypothetical protein
MHRAFLTQIALVARKMSTMHSINNSLSSIGRFNQHLADELAKLPEIRKFKTDSARLALHNFYQIYRFSPIRLDRMFERMDNIGLYAHRNYCSPLQALFWLVQDGKLESCGSLLGLNIVTATDAAGYCQPQLLAVSDSAKEKGSPRDVDRRHTLKKILDAAWNEESRLIPRSIVHQIIQGIQSEAEAEEYELLAKRHTVLQLQSYIMDDFLKKKEIFSTKDWDRIEQAVQHSRWKLFYTVADRLNSPELINYYMNKYFFFRKTPASGVYFVFFNNKAQCTDAAYFAEFMLKRAGYKTFMRSVKWDTDPWDGLHTGAGIILDDGQYLLVSNYTGINSIAGPFADVESLDQMLSCGREIIDRQWGAYYPPRYY